MKKILLVLAVSLTCGYTCKGQSAPYQNGLNGNGSYYSKGSSNYQPGIFVFGNRYNQTYAPGYSAPVYVPGFIPNGYYPSYSNSGYGYRSSGYVPQPHGWWRNQQPRR